MNKIIDTIGIEKIVKMIPHRYPMLLIDKVIEVKKGKSAIGIKNVTANENFFTGAKSWPFFENQFPNFFRLIPLFFNFS